MKTIKINYNDVDKGIEELETYDYLELEKCDKHVIYHVYWYGMIGRKQRLCMLSYLATQNLEMSSLWVWLDIETYNMDKSLIPNHKNIVIKIYNPNTEAKGTPLEGYSLMKQNSKLKFRSDLARIAILYKYGGVYYDLDMILLKDLRPLLGVEFCYRWSKYLTGNNAILRLFKESNNTKILINKYKKVLKNTIFTTKLNFKIFTDELPLYCFPCVMFDPVWIINDKYRRTTGIDIVGSKYSNLCNFDDFFNRTDEKVEYFFKNMIFAYHWHSRNNIKIENDSYFDKFEKYFETLL
tara:strand:+ start:93 stop:977 length:885 start_codon:yes stop_codon:yes gene_type:complete